MLTMILFCFSQRVKHKEEATAELLSMLPHFKCMNVELITFPCLCIIFESMCLSLTAALLKARFAIHHGLIVLIIHYLTVVSWDKHAN